MEIILVAFAKKFLLGANGSFRTQKGTSSQLLICCKECFTILYNERGQERLMKIILMVFMIGQFGHFSQKWNVLITLDHNSEFFIFIILRNKRSQEVHENVNKLFLSLIWGSLIFLGQFLLFYWACLKLN